MISVDLRKTELIALLSIVKKKRSRVSRERGREVGGERRMKKRMRKKGVGGRMEEMGRRERRNRSQSCKYYGAKECMLTQG